MRTVVEMTAFLEFYEKIYAGDEFTQFYLNRIASELLPDEHIVWTYHGHIAFSQYRLFICPVVKVDTGIFGDVKINAKNYALIIYDIKNIESIDIIRGESENGYTFKISMTGMEPKVYGLKVGNDISRFTEDVNYVMAHSKLHGGQDDVEALEVHFGIPQIKEYNNKIMEPLLRNAICYSGKSRIFLDSCLRELYPDEDVYLVLFVECQMKGDSGTKCIIATNQRLIYGGEVPLSLWEIFTQAGEAFRDAVKSETGDSSYKDRKLVSSIKYSEIVKIGNKLATYGNPAHVIIITAGGDIHLYPRNAFLTLSTNCLLL